jgi:uncharacterized phage protein (TIGR02218 family)
MGWADGSAIRSEGALRASNLELQGMITTDVITEDDLRRGLYDGAEILMRVVDWKFPFGGALMEFPYWFSNIEFSEEGWTAEIEGIGRWMNVKQNRVHGRTCPHDLFDTRCGLSSVGFVFTDVAMLSVITDRTVFRVHGDGGVSIGTVSSTAVTGALGDDYFTHGKITWTAGANTGFVSEVRVHADQVDGYYELSLYLPTPFDMDPTTDLFTLEAGDDKTRSTCLTKFNNVINFGGDPFMPGSDKSLASPG